MYESTIVFSEWLSTGVIVHFKGGVSVFFPAQFLYDQRASAKPYIPVREGTWP